MIVVTVSYFQNISMVCKVCSSYLSDRRRLELLDHIRAEQIKLWIVYNTVYNFVPVCSRTAELSQ